MKLRHVRDGMELERIVEDENYDHNFQQIRQLENETTILPGDYLITDCAYEVRNTFWTSLFLKFYSPHLFLDYWQETPHPGRVLY
jgi:hypothetical protein